MSDFPARSRSELTILTELQLSDGWQLSPVESGPVERVTVNGTDSAQANAQTTQAQADAAELASTGVAGAGGAGAGTTATTAGATQPGAVGADGQVRGADGRVQARAGH